MQTKKVIALLAMSSFVVSGLSGCQKTADANTQTATETTEQTQTVDEDEGYIISDEYIAIKEYKGLKYKQYESDSVKEEDIDQYIEFTLNSMKSEVYDIIGFPKNMTLNDIDKEAKSKSKVLTENNNASSEETDENITEENEATPLEQVDGEIEDTGEEPTSEVNYDDQVMPISNEPDNVDDIEKVMYTADDLTDELVKAISKDCTTVKEYRDSIKAGLEEQYKEEYINEQKRDLFQMVVDEAKLKKVDEARLKYYNDYNDKFYRDYADSVGVDFSTFYTETLGFVSEDEYNDFIKEQAEYDLKSEYVINCIAEAENITISETDINDEIQWYIKNGYKENEEEVLDYISKEDITLNLKHTKVLEIIINNVVYQ